MSRYSPEYLVEVKTNPMTYNFISRAIENKAILEAKVISCDKDGTLKLDLGKNIFGEIQFDELEYNCDGSKTKKISATSKVGKRIKFIPEEINSVNNEYIVRCSRKEAQRICIDKYISRLTPGDIIPARVVKIMKYGLFCDIGCGVIALLPTNNISVTHIVNPEEILKGLKRIIVIVKEVGKDHKIELSHKELLGTWEEEVSKFNEQDVVEGVVLSVEEYGVFVRLSQNLSGLAENVDTDLNYGDKVVVKITSIKKDNGKVKLFILSKAEEEQKEQLRFNYTKTSGHITKWVYSIDTAKKQIVTEFNNN